MILGRVLQLLYLRVYWRSWESFELFWPTFPTCLGFQVGFTATWRTHQLVIEITMVEIIKPSDVKTAVIVTPACFLKTSFSALSRMLLYSLCRIRANYEANLDSRALFLYTPTGPPQSRSRKPGKRRYKGRWTKIRGRERGPGTGWWKIAKFWLFFDVIIPLVWEMIFYTQHSRWRRVAFCSSAEQNKMQVLEF